MDFPWVRINFWLFERLSNFDMCLWLSVSFCLHLCWIKGYFKS